MSASVSLRTVNSTARDDRAIRRALRILESRARTSGDRLNTISLAADWFRLRFAELPYEVFAVAWLDAQNRLIEFRELFAGSVTGTYVHPREVLRSALACNAVNGILAHNHPSGWRGASEEDIALTEELISTLLLIDVRVLDHLIVAGTAEPFSMARARLIGATACFDIERRVARRCVAGG